ncbi:MAG: CdaR family protein [Bacillota bacterium]|nr:CdaR family protein [Bacillota bacterium]
MIVWLKKYDVLNKSLCLLAAVLLWFYVVSVQDPEKSNEIKNVKVKITGEEQLMSRYGLSVISVKNTTVNIKVHGRREKIAQVTPDKINVTASLDTIDAAGMYAITYQPTVLVDGVSVSGRSPAAITVEVDKISSVSVPVKLSDITKAQDGYYIESETITPQTVTITGPQEEIAKVSYALVSIDLSSKLSQTVDGAYEYTLVGTDGKEIVSANIKKSEPSVKLNISIKPCREVPLSVSLISAGGINSTYAEADISPKTVRIGGNKAVLDSTSVINLGAISLAGKEDGMVVTMRLEMPNGLVNVDGVNTVSIKIHLNGIEKKSFTVSKFDVVAGQIENAQYIFNVKANSIDIKLQGHNSVLNAITPDMLTAVADLRGVSLSDGITVQAPVNISIKDNPDVGLIGDYTVPVEVKKR